ncbi:MAG: response regulator [Acidobacteria bacterium]|nr:response regulator [Acidobacteriota bacterium]
MGRTVAAALLIACSFLLVSLSYGATALYAHSRLGSMSLLETLGFMFVSVGLFAAKPSPTLASLLRSKRASGWLTRMLLSAAVLVPFLLGLIALHIGAFNQQSRAIAAVFVVIQMVVFVVVTCTTMSRLAQSEEEDEATRQALVASERMLQESQKIEAIGVLAGGLAHDFNNLLNVISGYSELLLHDSSLGQMQRSKVEKIAKAGQTAAGLTRQLLAFSRKQVLQPQALDLNKIISSKDSYLHRFIKENIDFSTSLDPALMATLIDPTQLEQILLNLVINACDAMPEGGRLNITTTNVVLEELAAAENSVKPGAFVRLTMSDTGVGMDENTRTRIFEPFFTTKVVGKGTGLGLATVYGIVKQSGGFIKVDSKVGRGTTFLVFLPATRSPLSGDQQATATPHASGSATILLVEDSELLRELVFETLESMGYTVLMARDGREALRLCTQFSGTIDLVLSDVVMPKMNGPEVVKKVKEIRPEIAAIFMSGYADEAIIRRGQAHSGASFLQKPFTSSDLRDKVREVLVQAQEKRSVRERLNAAMLGRVKSLEVQDLD